MRQAIGALYQDDNTCLFRVWAPFEKDVKLLIEYPEKQEVKLDKDEWGYWSKTLYDLTPGTRYFFELGKKKRPDPASRSQSSGVHETSEVIDPSYKWQDEGWKGIQMEDMILYELHTGTFTESGTFEGIEEKLDYLLELGITAIELMPVAQFPGSRNWGYDGVYPFAVQDSYGGVKGLKHLVDTCHSKGMAVVLDVVYNHLGPEGNYMSDFGPYFTEKYNTPWGAALNFDDQYCDHVRNYFIQNVLMWFHEFHIDALRLDAIHAIFDDSAHPFLQEMALSVEELSKKDQRDYLLIAESDMNDVKVLRPAESGGFAMHGQWCDDFHHAIHSQITGEKDGYYADFETLDALAKSYTQSFVYDWKYSAYRKKTFGSNARPFHPERFVVFAQNHDQIGNRLKGERLSQLASFEALKLSLGAVLLSPYVPMLFMGEEYGEERPFQYFISHTDPDLVKAVREGRKREFRAFGWETEPPDPQSEKTFNACKLSFDYKEGKSNAMFEFTRYLIELRKKHPVLRYRERDSLSAEVEQGNVLRVMRKSPEGTLCILMNFGSVPVESTSLEGVWKKILDSSDEKWQGPGTPIQNEIENTLPVLQPESVVILERSV